MTRYYIMHGDTGELTESKLLSIVLWLYLRLTQ